MRNTKRLNTLRRRENRLNEGFELQLTKPQLKKWKEIKRIFMSIPSADTMDGFNAAVEELEGIINSGTVNTSTRSSKEFDLALDELLFVVKILAAATDGDGLADIEDTMDELN